MAVPEDEILKKYTEMVQGFKKSVEESLQNQTKAWNEVLNNGEQMQKIMNDMTSS